MKKLITLMSTVALIIFFMPSCKKTESQPAQTTLQKIQAKWQLQSDVYNDHYSGTNHITTQTGNAGDYIEFKTDGTATSFVSGYNSTVTYSLVGDTKIKIDADTYDIKTLTSNSFVLYLKTIYSGSDYDEETISLKK